MNISFYCTLTFSTLTNRNDFALIIISFHRRTIYFRQNNTRIFFFIVIENDFPFFLFDSNGSVLPSNLTSVLYSFQFDFQFKLGFISGWALNFVLHFSFYSQNRCHRNWNGFSSIIVTDSLFNGVSSIWSISRTSPNKKNFHHFDDAIWLGECVCACKYACLCPYK